MVVRPDFLNINRRSGSRFKIKEVEGVATCDPNPCKNNGECRIHNTCICPVEYTGTLCEDNNLLVRCGFEKNICNISVRNFTKTNSFLGIPVPPEGKYYALASISAPERKNAAMVAKLPLNKLEVMGKSVRVDFSCATMGSALLDLLYHDGKKNGTSEYAMQNVTSIGQWENFGVNLPTGEDMVYVFLAKVGGKTGQGAVAVDNIRFTKPKEK
ncbi:uncharacterized protein LOC133191562 [Saccostrea echinata]|uniref:uncharacterized protein LOC133191562 n=1 Tax=Saccostrea echinata TaxID=191078 RepID=UPI002A83271F|nr:uncharacterized protein LOC133191562 [Saccostrea echinata]